MNATNEGSNRRGSNRRFWLVIGTFLAIAGFMLWEEHKVHMLGALPWLILALCPLMHVFMHGGHGGHGGHTGTARRAERTAMAEQVPAYGLWGLVILSSATFIFFPFSFFRPQSKPDWRSFGIEWREYASRTPRFLPRLLSGNRPGMGAT